MVRKPAGRSNHDVGPLGQCQALYQHVWRGTRAATPSCDADQRWQLVLLPHGQRAVSEAARGCTKLHEAAQGCTRLPEAARGCPRLHEAARGCTRLHEASRTQSSHDDLVLQVDAFAQDSELLGDLEGQFAGRARGEERKGPGRGRARERVRDAWATGAPRGHGRRTDRVGVSTKANTP